MRRKFKFLAVLGLVVLVLLFGGAATEALGLTWVRWSVERTVGPKATFCGTAPWRGAEAQEQVKTCVEKHLASRAAPFWAAIDAPGVDSQLKTFLSRDNDGVARVTRYDSSPSGMCFVFCIWSTRTAVCPSPEIRRVDIDGHGRWTWLSVRCESA